MTSEALEKASAIWHPSQGMATPGYKGGLRINQANAESRTIELICRVIEVSSSCFTGTILGAVILYGSHGTPTVPFALHYLPCHPVRGFCQDLLSSGSGCRVISICKIDAAFEVPTMW